MATYNVYEYLLKSIFQQPLMSSFRAKKAICATNTAWA